MSEFQDIFNASTEAGDDKNTTLRKMIEAGCDVTMAIREYTKLAREVGLVLSPKERTQRINVELENWGGDWSDATARKEIAEELADKYDIAQATAMAHLKAYAEEHDIDIPSANRATAEEMVAFVKQCYDAGDERADIVVKLQDEFGYTPNSAASAISRANRELGVSSGNRSKVDISIIVEKIRASEDAPRKEASTRIAEETGLSAATVNAYFGYLAFAKEYSRQEAEAA
jgi:hypothetical protein